MIFRLLSLTACLFASATRFAASADDDVIAACWPPAARSAALLAADTKSLDRLLADDLRYTHSNGKVETKAIHIDAFAGGLRYARFQTSNLHGHVISPDVVVLTGSIDQRKGVPEKWKDYRLLFHAVWRKDAASDLQACDSRSPARSWKNFSTSVWLRPPTTHICGMAKRGRPVPVTTPRLEKEAGWS